ncbi:MAG: PcfJ domain-containing protein [Negativicutes bacterium]|nr:PcfJ domain-containing protein [Negativicutes bacterium]
MTIEEILEHFPTNISDEIKAYVTDRLLVRSRYIFTWREKRQQWGYCTHCRTTFKTSNLKHLTDTNCPNCESHCQSRQSGVSRSKLMDEGYFVYYEKSTYDPDTIIARGIYVMRDYRKAFRNVDTKYMIRASYLFAPGRSAMLKRYAYFSDWDENDHIGEWQRCKTIYSLFTPVSANGWGGFKDMYLSYSRESIAAAVAGTPFRYSTWEKYDVEDMTKFFGFYANYPCIEYLTKLGFTDIVRAKLTGGNTFGAINWRGKTIMKVLKLTKDDLKEIKSKEINVDTYFLHILHLSRKDGSNFTFEEIFRFDKELSGYLSDFKQFMGYTTMRRAFSYIEKQTTVKDSVKGKPHYGSSGSVIYAWRDYIRDCTTLGFDLTSERILFPSNLYKAHQATIKQVKVKEDELINKKLADRVKKLQHYCFEDSGLLIRPAASTKELIDEGKALEHCVGTYAQSYAEGRSIILFIRKVDDPQKPYFTMEIRNDQVSQCRGKKNCDMDKTVKAFVETFKAQRLTKPEKIRVPVAV